MATTQPHPGPVGPDTLITVKVLIDGMNRRFKLALRDLGAHSLPQKLRFLLAVPPECEVRFDRFSDSAGTYIALDSTNPAIYKQLYRAAKAKLKLRLRATVLRPFKIEAQENETTILEEAKSVVEPPRQSSYLETVLSPIPVPSAPLTATQHLAEASCISSKVCDTSKPPSRAEQLSRPTIPSMTDFSCGAFSIDCNACDRSIPDEHYHCSICEVGDFDLCQSCVDAGITCYGEDHWLIKRSIKNGRVLPSVTEILPPKNVVKDSSQEQQQATPLNAPEEEERTCNGCVNQLHASLFVTCKDCPDFDLCFSCFTLGQHGHHPAHAFEPVEVASAPALSSFKEMCAAGRGVHHDAICDQCDKQINGVRHKCLSCPDFDYCSTCIDDASEAHPGHRFAPLYQQIAPLRNIHKSVHHGIFCDGPICAGRARKTWIRGDRYKCTVCHDFDLCANCEAYPKSAHNATHPLLKMRTPVRFVSVSTVEEKDNVDAPVTLGDRPLARNASTETTRPTSINAATQVQTVAEVKPAEVRSEKVDASKPKTDSTSDLEAWFMSDSTPDGSTFAPNHRVSQSWTLRNPGPQTWPAGCAVYFIGGDDMRNLDTKHPSSVSDMVLANRSNVLEEPLEPGKTAVFTVLLKSPPRECQALSFWSLKTPAGQPFGHKLWVDITVKNPPTNATSTTKAPVSAPVPEPFQLEETKSTSGSTMIFPKLDKESPASSTHDVKTNKSMTSIPIETDDETVAATENNHEEDRDLIEDLESLDIEDDEDTDNGFLTDEEYDILDADDEDFLEEAQKAVMKK